MPKLGPHSQATAFARLGTRTREGKLFYSIRADLLRHIGAAPSITQVTPVERAAGLGLHLALMDRDIAEGKVLSERNGRQYLAWSNSYVRVLRDLGLKSSAAKPRRTLTEHLAERAAGAAA